MSSVPASGVTISAQRASPKRSTTVACAKPNSPGSFTVTG